MIKITKLTLRNFLSTGNVTQALKLDDAGLTLVLGSNTDANGGTTRNGAGKTTILQAISYALFGKPLTRVRIPNLVNNINNKGMMVTIEFARDDKTYRVERGQKPAFLRFFVNDKEIKGDEVDLAQGENRHTQEEIERVLGMTHTMFKHIVALNTFTDPFLKMSVADQRAVIEELLGVTQISQRAEVLKKLIAQTKEAVRDQEAQVKATAEANARIEVAVKQAEAQVAAWERQHARRLDELAGEIEAVRAIDFDAEIAAFDALDRFVQDEREFRVVLESEQREATRLAKEVKTLEGEGARLKADAAKIGPEAQIARLEGEIARKQKTADKHREKADALGLDLAQAEADLAGADRSTCVCCGQALVGTDHLATVTANLTKRVEAIRAQIAAETADAEDILAEVAPIRDEIAQVAASAAAAVAELLAQADAKATQAQETRAKQREHAARLAEAQAAIQALGAKPKPLFASRDEVYKAKQTHDTLLRDLEQEAVKENPFTSQVESLRGTLHAIDYEPLNDLNDLFKHQDFLLKLLTSKDSFIRKRIIDQNLAYLNTRLNLYLDKLGLPHEVRFLSDLSVEITLLGRDFDFEQLSRGEMNRVIMATSWSFRDVWESMNDTLNLVLVDEFLDQGTDGSGAEAGLAVLKTMARDRKKNVFLISHRDDLVGRIDHVMLVRKDNGFSSFVLDGSLD